MTHSGIEPTNFRLRNVSLIWEKGKVNIIWEKGEVLKNHNLHREHSRLGFTEAVHQWLWKIPHDWPPGGILVSNVNDIQSMIPQNLKTPRWFFIYRYLYVTHCVNVCYHVLSSGTWTCITWTWPGMGSGTTGRPPSGSPSITTPPWSPWISPTTGLVSTAVRRWHGRWGPTPAWKR